MIVRKVTDEHPDLSWLGKITDKWEPGAVKLREGEGDRWGRQSWYVSCNHPDVAKEARSLNQDHGRERHTADCEVRRYRTADLRRLLDYGNGWIMLGIVVEARRHGVRLGSVSLWGIESDSDASYFDISSRIYS